MDRFSAMETVECGGMFEDAAQTAGQDPAGRRAIQLCNFAAYFVKEATKETIKHRFPFLHAKSSSECVWR